MIAILCPTRGRPEGFKRMVESAAYAAKYWPDGKIKIYVGTNEDHKNIIYDNILKFPIDCPTVYMWNRLAEDALEDSNNKLFMLGSDDMVFETPGWDKALIDHYDKLENKIHVYHLRDSRDERGTPHPIVTREYIEEAGYFIPPIFLHWFADTWTVEIARFNNCFTHFKDYLLIHDKPSDKGQPDETHRRIRRNGWHQRDQAVNDSCQHFLELEKQRLTKAMQ